VGMSTTSWWEIPSTVRVPGWEIPAALTLPTTLRDGEIVPSAILLVPGSLFSDVNGDYPSWNVYPHVYAHLARHLSARGPVALIALRTSSCPT
jgi:uncharacterized protein